jgi:hypothetical protein
MEQEIEIKDIDFGKNNNIAEHLYLIIEHKPIFYCGTWHKVKKLFPPVSFLDDSVVNELAVSGSSYFTHYTDNKPYGVSYCIMNKTKLEEHIKALSHGDILQYKTFFEEYEFIDLAEK